MIDELEPLGVQRSFSVPISGPKGGVARSTPARTAQVSIGDKSGQAPESSTVKLDEDE
jgi:hypothetical protein